MSQSLSRRRFLNRTLGASMAVPLVRSVEEHRLLTHAPEAAPAARPMALTDRWFGRIGGVKISRLICGGNLISGYAHSRDLTYVSTLLKHYHTDDKVMETWALCEANGINTMIAYPGDPNCIRVYGRYRAKGGKIQYIAQIRPDVRALSAAVSGAVEAGAVGAFLVGNLADEWARKGAAGRIAEVVGLIKDAGLVAGVAGHELRTIQAAERAGAAPDFYVKTLHSQNYWSRQQPSQELDVIDNYGIDNYWCREPDKVIDYMARIERPWIAYKVLAAGAIAPKDGFTYAFRNGADFAAVGMFDFQVAADAAVANDVLAQTGTRTRAWRA